MGFSRKCDNSQSTNTSTRQCKVEASCSLVNEHYNTDASLRGRRSDAELVSGRFCVSFFPDPILAQVFFPQYSGFLPSPQNTPVQHTGDVQLSSDVRLCACKCMRNELLCI